MDRRNFLKASLATLCTGFVAKAQAANAVIEQAQMQDSEPRVWSAEHKKASKRDLRVKFLGTGAAGWKRPGGKSRRHSSAMLDGKVLIDLTKSHDDMLPQKNCPKVIFYTHSHGDHFQPKAALAAGIERAYVHSSWRDRAIKAFQKAADETGKPMPEIIGTSLNQKIEEQGLTLTPLPANHATNSTKEQAVIYLIEKPGIRVLYATDTAGIMAMAAWWAGIDPHMAKGTPITGLIMESTMGMEHDEDFRIFAHSSAATVYRTTNMLLREGRLTMPEGQPVYLTHMALSLNPKQEEMDRTLPYPLRAAYDGLETVFSPVKPAKKKR